MKTTALLFGCILSLITLEGFSQDRTTVTANSNEISDNLDLRAVAHVFGESENLEDFERRLNDPSLKISNLDLNYDNQVDYMRVIESVEDYTHLIIIQAVIGRDSFQDIATLEVEKDRRNRTIQVQIVGNTFIYGSNYIYEPVYYHAPVIYRHFWVPNYVVYYSPWAWSFYPTYYYAWNPWPIYTYHNHVNYYVNVNNSCYYTNYRRSNRAVAMHHSYRGNAYERQNPNRSFSERNRNVSNRHELAQTRGKNFNNGRTAIASNTRDQNTSASQTRGNQSKNITDRNTVTKGGSRDQNVKSSSQVRGNESIRTNDRSLIASNGSRDQYAVKGKNQSIDRTFTSNSRGNNGTVNRSSETRTATKSHSTVNRSNSKPSKSSDFSMNQSRSSKPNVSANTPTRSNSSSATRSTNSSQRSSGGNSGSSSNNKGGRS